MPSVQQQNKPSQYQINQATTSYREILRGRRDNPETDKIFAKLGVDVEKEKESFGKAKEKLGIEPYKKVEVSDALAAKIEAKKNELKASWAEQDKKDGPPYESMVLAREKKLLKEFYVQGETEEAYYKRQHDIKDLDKRIKQAQADQANSMPEVVAMRERFDKSKEHARNVQAEADSRKVAVQSVSNGSKNGPWDEARARNNAVRDRQIANISESTRPARDFDNERLTTANFQPGGGFDVSRAPAMESERTFAITNPGMAKRFSMSSPTSQAIVAGEAEVAAGRAYKISEYGKLPVYHHINTPEEIIAKHQPEIDRSTAMINLSLARDPSGKSLNNIEGKLHYANRNNVHISGPASRVMREMAKDYPENEGFQVASDNLESMRSDKMHEHLVNDRSKTLRGLGYNGNPQILPLEELRGFKADISKINRYIRGDRFGSNDMRGLANVCSEYGLSLSELESHRRGGHTDKTIEIKGKMLARITGNRENSTPTPNLTPRAMEISAVRQSNQEASTVSPEVLAQAGKGLSILLGKAFNGLTLPPVPERSRQSRLIS